MRKRMGGTADGAAGDTHLRFLFADYSDPDVIRVGDQYVMTASTFHFSPGLPVLASKDLVHWRILAHALPRLPFGPAYDLPGPLDFDEGSQRARLDPAMGHRYSAGVWAPAISAITTAATTSTSPPPPTASSWFRRNSPKDRGPRRWRWSRRPGWRIPARSGTTTAAPG